MMSDQTALAKFVKEHADELLELFDELAPDSGVGQLHLFPNRPGERMELIINRRTGEHLAGSGPEEGSHAQPSA